MNSCLKIFPIVQKNLFKGRARYSLLLLSILFLFTFPNSPLQAQTSKNNYSGNWTDNNSWVGGTAPVVININSNVIIYGNIERDGNLSFNNGTLTVYDTLRIYGNLTLGNNAELTISSGAILIIYGDFLPGNQTTSLAGGTLVITGDLIKGGAANQGDFDISTGNVYIFGSVENAGSGYQDLNCIAPDTFPDCGYGDIDDIINDPVFDFFELGFYSISASGSTTFCEGQSVTLSVVNTASWYQWYFNDAIISGANSFSYSATLQGNYHARMRIGTDTITVAKVFVTVYPAPTVTLAPLAAVCVDAASFALSGGLPAGGSYSGSGVATGSFDPSVAGAGTHAITYTYTDANGCSNSAVQNIVVNDLPVVTLRPSCSALC
jgi:hypothetical protein